MSNPGEVRAGDTLGRYELLVPIAQGGMAVVWAARMKGTRGFQKIVAVKSMLPSLSSDSQFEEMFLAEAGVAARIRAPNVCEIFDLGEEEGTLYIVMEWVDGEALSSLHKGARAKKRAVPFSIIARVIKDAALGLHAAHEIKDDAGNMVGLVHRDVSPQNILVTYDGVVKIVDFGVAKAKGLADGLTQTGQIKGKVPFMAPEQVHGKPLDRRADIFALGVVLYQLLTGKHPFRGDSDLQTMRQILTANPPVPSTVVPGCPPELDLAVMRALAKDREKRFQTMADFARAMEQAIGEMAAAGDTLDVGEFVRDVLGERGDKRRDAIKEAIRVGEERERRRAAGGPVSVRGDSTGVSNVSMLTIPLATELSPAVDSVVGVAGRDTPPPSTSRPAANEVSPAISQAPKRPRRAAVTGVLAIAGLLGAVAVFMPRPGGSAPAAPAAEASTAAGSDTTAAAAPLPATASPPQPPSTATVDTTSRAVDTAPSAAPSADPAPTSAPAAKSTPPVVPGRGKLPAAKSPSSPRKDVPKIRTPGF
jgi:hypothetical protein